MLITLSLHDFVIVDELHLSFDEGLTVLTGETGAGKSIILDALGLLLGDKADFGQIRQGQKEARLSAQFSLTRLPELQSQLNEQGFLSADEDEVVIRRIIDAKGKSRNFINGQSATLAQLKSMGEMLLDIHGQSAHHSLNYEKTQRQILDAYSGCLKTAESVKEAHRQWQDAQQHLNEAQENQQQREAERERWQWQKQELDKLNPQANEWEELSQSYDTLAHAADLRQAAERAEAWIDGENGLQNLVTQCQKTISPWTEIEPRFAECLDLLQSIEAELDEVNTHVRDIGSRIDIDPQALAYQEERMGQLSAMAKKYRIDVQTLPQKHEEIIAQLNTLEEENNQEILQAQCQKAEQQYHAKAKILSQQRQQGALKLSKEVSDIMHTLSMERAVFQVALIDQTPSAHGNERIVYQVAVNAGSALSALNKVASGGELARISLAIQVAAGAHTGTPTLIFDEVDSGIGGRVADTVGQRLAELAQKHQVLLITHLAQVAAYADRHWQVHKHEQNGQTISTISALDDATRIEEIARMIGGKQLSETTLQHAKEMIEAAQRGKS